MNQLIIAVFAAAAVAIVVLVAGGLRRPKPRYPQ
jgi:hypothetical protein